VAQLVIFLGVAVAGYLFFQNPWYFPVHYWVGLVCGDANLARTQGWGV